MESALVADHILRLSSAHIPRRRLDLAITVLLLQSSGRNASLGYDGLRKRRYQIDHRLVVELLKTTKDRDVQRAIVQSPAFGHLPGRLFHRLFFDYWRLRFRSSSWRYALGWSLHVFLQANPRDGRLYAEPIWKIATDLDETVALVGLANTQFLGDALTLAQAKALIALTGHESERAIAAISNIGGLYRDFENLRPEVRTLLQDPRTIAILRIRHPRDSAHKWSAHNWCLMNMRKALRRARKAERGRKASRQ